MRLFEIIKPIDNKRDIIDVYSPDIGGINNYSSEKIENVLEFIENHCSEFCSAVRRSNNFLYRAIPQGKAPQIFIATSPKHRIPQGQGLQHQQIFDKILSSAGFLSLRTNSICTTTDLSFVKDWGTPYFIFPLNGFSFTWSNFIRDVGGSTILSSTLKKLFPKYYIFPEANRPDINTGNLPKPSVAKFVKDMQYKNDDLSQALKSNHEISIHGQYVAIVFNFEYGKQIQKHFGITV
jgi:hypothetical protein